MANLTNILLILLAMNIASILVLGVNDQSGNSLFEFLLNPGSMPFESTKFWIEIGLCIGVAGALFGGLLFKNDTLIYGSLFAMMIGFAYAPMVSMFDLIAKTYNSQIAMLIVAPFYLYYIITCISWLRGRA